MLSDGKIIFKGATSDIEYTTHLDLPEPLTPLAGKAIIPKSR